MSFWNSPRIFPLVIAHRGASRKAPENTLAAFSKAIDDGADGIELDVRLTRDRGVVVFHDSRLERTTDGAGRIERVSLHELAEVNAGSWFHPVFREERIPTLDQVFELVGKRIGVNIEIKSDLRTRRSSAIVDEVLAVIRRHRAEQYVLLSSFYHPFIRRARAVRPDLAVGYLFHTVTAFGRAPLRRTRRGVGSYIILNGSSCTRRLVARAHDSGIRVGEYTVNSRRRLNRGVRFGVDAIYTDDPAFILSELTSPK